MALSDVIPGFQGTLITADHPDYDQNRRVWNGLHDMRPSLIAQCVSESDVAAALAYGRRHGLPIAVRGGGHSLPGFSSCDDGVVVDLRRMNGVVVDAPNRRARVQGGALLGDVDAATQAYGLALPSGVISHTGVGGLTLGGGVGRLMRRYGLTIDNLVGVTMVSVDGETVRADADTNPELFWALRGGGGNFGVVTEFEFVLHELTELVSLTSFAPLSELPAALALGREIAADAPDDLTWKGMVRLVPPLPWVPKELVGQVGIRSTVEWTGDLDEGQARLEKIAGRLPAGGTNLARVPFLDLQRAHDEEMRTGIRSYAKATFVQDLTPELARVLVEWGAKMKSWGDQIEIIGLGGAIARVPVDATAFAHRTSPWLLNVPANWFDPADDEREIAWSRGTFAALEPFGNGLSYSNFMSVDDPTAGEPARDEIAYGATLARLQAVKAQWDPDNVLRLNQNIEPRSAGG